MDIEIADQFAKLVGTIDGHPWASFAGGLFILLLAILRKDGLLSQLLQYLTAKATREAALEERRIDLIKMIEDRHQPMLPGIRQGEHGEGQ